MPLTSAGFKGDRRFNYLLHAENYGDDLTPAENRRRINAARAGIVRSGGAGASLPGQASNAGISQRMPREQRENLKQGAGRRGR